jgi:hypothetical protein
MSWPYDDPNWVYSVVAIVIVGSVIVVWLLSA